MVKTSISFQGWHLPCGRTCQIFGVSEAGTAEKENDQMFRVSEITDARFVLPVNKLHRDGED